MKIFDCSQAIAYMKKNLSYHDSMLSVLNWMDSNPEKQNGVGDNLVSAAFYYLRHCKEPTLSTATLKYFWPEMKGVCNDFLQRIKCD